MKKGVLIVVAIVVIAALYGFSTYNRIVSANEIATTQWAQVESQYQRRFDLIPNLVESVEGVMQQEEKIFLALADARTRYAGAKSADEKAAAATQVEGALSRLLVIVENYPQLKSAENVQTLMAQLEGMENRVSVERKRYNDAIRNYNLVVKRFPSSVIAGWAGFAERPYFEAAAGADEVPAVKF